MVRSSLLCADWAVSNARSRQLKRPGSVVQHHCIYCDSRSECYGIADFDNEVLVKANAPELLRVELRRKRVKGYVSTGSMNDAYMPLEREVGLTRRALEILLEFAFPLHLLTKKATWCCAMQRCWPSWTARPRRRSRRAR
jgi:hypothetical protein